MLPAQARLRRREDFTRALRAGRRAGCGAVVVHLALPSTRDGAPSQPPARAGFIVSKAVGNAVVRHRVARQLRHLVADRLAAVPPGGLLVVRALPTAAGRPSAQLGRDIDAALRRLTDRPPRSGGAGPR